MRENRLGTSGGDAVVKAGYHQDFKREFSFWSAFTLAFAFISPMIGLYGIFALALEAGGPAFWWGFGIVLGGQLLAALIFAEMASVAPLAGGVYQWSRQYLGDAYGWFAGWSYVLTLLITMAAVAYGAATFLTALVGVSNPSTITLVVFALAILVFSTFINTAGRRYLDLIVRASIACELIGSVFVGTILLIFYHHNPISVLFETPNSMSTLAYLSGPFLASLAFVGWALVGFESAGSIAEEVRNPAREVPVAIVLSLVVVAIVIAYAGLALVLAIPNIGAVMSGSVADPITDTLARELGASVSKPLFFVIVVGFVAGLSALQTAVSRSIFSIARDKMLPFDRWLSKLSHRDQLPINAVIASFIIPALMFLLVESNAYSTLVSFATGGFYISFAFPVMAALVVRLKGEHPVGPFSLGHWGMPINICAIIWLVFEAVNIAWPRTPTLPWYENYGVTVMTAVVAGTGIILYFAMRRRFELRMLPSGSSFTSGASISERVSAGEAGEL